MPLQQIIFIFVVIVAAIIFSRRIFIIRNNILSGKKEDLTDCKKDRWKNMALMALGQKKMFNRPIPGILHFFVYTGFIIINIEILEIIIDGVIDYHRVFAPSMGAVYDVFISAFEVLAFLVIIACALFLIRRYGLRIKRFYGKEMTTWPKTDATLILVTEIILMSLFLMMNSADLTLQSMEAEHYTLTGSFLISGYLQSMFGEFTQSQLVFIERFGWWAHILGVMAFAIYVTYSKHLHIFLAFPNNYYIRFEGSGEMENMPSITKEVQMMLNPGQVEEPGETDEPPGSFGVKDVTDLSWKSLMDAYSCTECGRCTSVCPANITGKQLSPRKIMMDTRDRLEEWGAFKRKNEKDTDDGKSLLHDYITVDELNACTTCQACVEECPVNIRPLDIIFGLRRYLIMEESNAPNEWNLMFNNIENNAAPWQFSPEDRANWVNELN
jgi:heterodisulfide reductase subunit C